MRVLMIGLGGIGQRHLRNLRTLRGDTVEIAAFRVRGNSTVLTASLQIEPGNSVEEKYNVTVFDHLDAALEWNPDAVFICNPSSLRMAVALAAVKAGCHLFIEKPLSHDLVHMEELIGLIEQKGRVCLVAYQLRFHPLLKRAAELLDQKAIGRVIAVRAEVGEYLPGWHPYEDYRHMYASRSELGGGVILSQIHEMDYLYWLFGMPRRLFAVGGKLSNLEINVEDTASVLMDCNGVPVHLHQDYLQRPPSRTLQVIGDAGKILADFRLLTLQYFDGSGELAESRSWEGFERNQLFLDELSHFLACVEGREKPLVNARDGAQSLRMALAAKESIASGRVIDLQ